MIRNRFAALAAALVFVLGVEAQALSLLDLNAGVDFTSTDGALQFEFEPGSVVLAASWPPTFRSIR